MPLFNEIVTPTEPEIRQAQESSRLLAPLLNGHATGLRVRLQDANGGEEVLDIPEAAFRVLEQILREMAKGNSVSLSVLRPELSEFQAADLLNVSLTHLSKLLDDNILPSRYDGPCRLVPLKELLAYKERDFTYRSEIAAQLTAEAQAMGLY